MSYSSLVKDLFDGSKSITSTASRNVGNYTRQALEAVKNSPQYALVPIATGALALGVACSDGGDSDPTGTQEPTQTVGATYTPGPGLTSAPTQTAGPTQTFEATPKTVSELMLYYDENWNIYITKLSELPSDREGWKWFEIQAMVENTSESVLNTPWTYSLDIFTADFQYKATSSLGELNRPIQRNKIQVPVPPGLSIPIKFREEIPQVYEVTALSSDKVILGIAGQVNSDYSYIPNLEGVLNEGDTLETSLLSATFNGIHTGNVLGEPEIQSQFATFEITNKSRWDIAVPGVGFREFVLLTYLRDGTVIYGSPWVKPESDSANNIPPGFNKTVYFSIGETSYKTYDLEGAIVALVHKNLDYEGTKYAESGIWQLP